MTYHAKDIYKRERTAGGGRNSSITVTAARVPSSIAPSMKLRQPTAQSEFAKSTFPCRLLSSSNDVDRSWGGAKNHAPLANSSLHQL